MTRSKTRRKTEIENRGLPPNKEIEMTTRTKKTAGITGRELFTGHLLDHLNPEQRQVAEHKDGAALVVAVAGAGKTTAVVHRVANLIAGHGVKPSEILAVTFSKKAAEEMNERLEKLNVFDARVGTWHSVAWEILRKEAPEYEEWELDDRDRFRTMVKVVLGYQGMNWTNVDLGVVMQYIGICKANLAESGSEGAEKIAREFFEENPCGQTSPQLLMEAYHRATEAQNQRRILTFDDMLVGCWKVLSTDENARARWSSKWNYVIQDEAQDENLAQITIGELLARSHGNYMMVGDPAQSIYGFRGAVPAKLLAFEHEWNAKVIRMHRNYRSGPEVIAAANGVIKAMDPTTHLGVMMQAERTEPAEIVVKETLNFDTEGEEVVQRLMEYNAGGMKWGDMVVLYRTNAQSRGVEESCLSNRIPYVILGGTNFYNRKEVKDLLAYVRLGAGRGDFEDVRRSINSPFRFLGRAFVDRVEELGGSASAAPEWTALVRKAAEQSGIQARQRTSVLQYTALVESLKQSIEIVRREREDRQGVVTTEVREKHGPAALLERVIKETDYMRFITRDEGAETAENNRVSNIRELVRASERFATVDELLDYIERTLAAAKDAQNERGDRVTLCSLHRSKGLEWPVVFILGCNEKVLPHARAKDEGEERRLFYVGITRARDHLHLSYVMSAAVGDKVIGLAPSRFLSEAGVAASGVAA